MFTLQNARSNLNPQTKFTGSLNLPFIRHYIRDEIWSCLLSQCHLNLYIPGRNMGSRIIRLWVNPYPLYLITLRRIFLNQALLLTFIRFFILGNHLLQKSRTMVWCLLISTQPMKGFSMKDFSRRRQSRLNRFFCP